MNKEQAHELMVAELEELRAEVGKLRLENVALKKDNAALLAERESIKRDIQQNFDEQRMKLLERNLDLIEMVVKAYSDRGCYCD